MNIPVIMARSLIITILIELSIAVIIGYERKDLINVMLVNIATNPLVVSIPILFNARFGLFERNVVLLLLEIVTILFEGLIYSKFNRKVKINPYLVSFILNLSSYSLGLIINYFG